MSDLAFVRLMLVLLLLICACLMLLDQQRQRQLAGVRGEMDNLHARLNEAGMLPKIRARRGLGELLRARSNDDLNRYAKESL